MKTLNKMSCAELRELLKTADERLKPLIQIEIDGRFPVKLVYEFGSVKTPCYDHSAHR